MPHDVYQCMEVWGGNQPADNGVVMPGVDAWVYSRPYEDDDAGGDVHYVSSCATGRITRFLVADVSGHGAQVASVAISLRTLMRRFINYIDQGRLVRMLNDEFSILSEAGVFATAVVATYFTPTGYLTLCNAGHPRPLLFTGATGKWRVLTSREAGATVSPGASNIPLGIAEGVAYDQVGVRLADSDVVLFYTDALVEAMNSQRELLGEAGLIEALEKGGVGRITDLREMLAAVAKVIEDFGGKVKDDVTILAIRPNALKPRVTFGEQARATGRFLKMVLTPRKNGVPLPWPEVSLVNLLGPFVGRVNRLWGGKR